MAGFSEVAKPTLADIVDVLDQSPEVSYAVDVDLHVTYCNSAWNRFAADNGAPELEGSLGADLHSVIEKDLRPFYLQAFEQVAHSGSVWECTYQCSSPELFRKFKMRIYPLRPAGCSLVTNSLVLERPHVGAVQRGVEGYVDSHGRITMCCHCRNSRRTAQPEHWDFVPAHLEPDVHNISHGLCPLCLEYFYPK